MPDNTNTSKVTNSAKSEFAVSAKVFTPPWYYRVLIKLLKPIYRVALWRRHKKAIKTGLTVADYNDEIAARFGHHYPQPPILPAQQDANISENTFKNRTIWCHAVSLGETNTIAPLLKIMLDKGAKIWLTNTTQTGFSRAELIFTDAIQTQQLTHSFVPVDDKPIIENFIAHVQPELALFVETELWPTIMSVLHKHAIPSVLVNARLSENSYKNYAKYASVSKGMMHNISMIIAQDADSAKRFRRLGTPVPKIRRADSLKWSTTEVRNEDSTSAEYTQQLQALATKFSSQSDVLQRPIWVAGSTHDGEEGLVLAVHQQLLQMANLANALLILVPRHPERFEAVATLIENSGLQYSRRSKNQMIEADTQVYLVDSMGELTECYALADVTFVGGSLVDVGGHNPIEAASLAKPVIMGEFTQSCHELVTALKEVGALKVVHSYQDGKHKNSKESHISSVAIAQLVNILAFWLQDSKAAKQAGRDGQNLVKQKHDALHKQLDMIEDLLSKRSQITVDTAPSSDIVDFDHFEVRTRTDVTDTEKE